MTRMIIMVFFLDAAIISNHISFKFTIASPLSSFCYPFPALVSFIVTGNVKRL
jgi:hypothetical protein